MLLLLAVGCAPTTPSLPRVTNGDIAYDADDDGFADVAIVSMPETVAGGRAGSLELFYGGPDGLDQARSASFPISMPYAQARWIGDINGDGFADAAVSTDFFGRPPSVSLAYGGPRGSTTTAQVQCNQGAAPTEERGAITDWVGDLDGDGVDDLVVTSGGGRICVWAGRSGSLSGDPDWFEQDTANNVPVSNAAPLFRGLGDVDGDGHVDLAFSGIIRRGGPDMLTSDTLTLPKFPLFGRADVNGDGFVDLVGGRQLPLVFDVWLGEATGFDSAVSAAHIVDLETAVVTIESELVHLGDLNGDGHHEAAVSIPFRDAGDVTTDGRVALLMGDAAGFRGGAPAGQHIMPDSEFLPSTEEVGLNGFRLGLAIGIGDIDGDGFGDLGVEVMNGGLAWFHGTSRGIRTTEIAGYVLVNRASPRMASTGPGAL